MRTLSLLKTEPASASCSTAGSRNMSDGVSFLVSRRAIISFGALIAAQTDWPPPPKISIVYSLLSTKTTSIEIFASSSVRRSRFIAPGCFPTM